MKNEKKKLIYLFGFDYFGSTSDCLEHIGVHAYVLFLVKEPLRTYVITTLTGTPTYHYEPGFSKATQCKKHTK